VEDAALPTQPPACEVLVQALARPLMPAADAAIRETRPAWPR
jgi:hypothetical protein